MLRLFSYKMKVDSGFAPNPFWGILTLATCKADMRRTKKRGDWIAGFTSKQLCSDEVGEERLIYLMQVAEKVTIREYFKDDRFRDKIPVDKGDGQCIYKAGDNIYRPTCPDAWAPEHFVQLRNWSHCESNKGEDIYGEFVLIADTFFYFGKEALNLPEEVRPTVPPGQAGQGFRTYDDALAWSFIEYITAHYSVGIHGRPHRWPEGDASWDVR